MKIFVSIGLSVFVIFFLSIGISCSQSTDTEKVTVSQKQDYAVVGVSPKGMKYIKSLDPQIVFFTSKKKPLRHLKEISNPSTEVASFLSGISEVWGLLEASGIKFKSTGAIGDGHFDLLFKKNPNLRLFITYDPKIRPRVNSISESGGGIRIKFVER